MTPPSGPIVAKPMLKRACGCIQEFQYYTVDRYRKQRQAKFESTRCPECAAKVIASKIIPTKNEAFGRLPAGTRMLLERLSNGTWSGSLTVNGTSVEANASGPQSLTVALAQQWASRMQEADSGAGN